MNFTETKPLVKVRPLVMLTGFLGAGKTTLMRRTLDALAVRELRADVILNDHENASLDCETLRGHAATVTALAGSCVCCEGLDELTDLLLTSSRTRHALLFVELNGTADPLPLLETFTVLESRFLLQPRWQVCVLDARLFGKRTAFRDLEALQLETASHYHLAHTEKLTPVRELHLRKHLHSINPKATEIDAPALAENLAMVLAGSRRHTVAPRPRTQFSRSGIPHLHSRHHLAHEFTGCQILLPEPLKATDLFAWLAALPDSVIRAKALVRTTEIPDYRMLFERVGTEISPEPFRVPIRDTVPSSAILIGPDLNPPELLETTRRILDPACSLS